MNTPTPESPMGILTRQAPLDPATELLALYDIVWVLAENRGLHGLSSGSSGWHALWAVLNARVARCAAAGPDTGNTEDAPGVCTIPIPTRAEYEAEVPAGVRSWAGHLGQLVAAALEDARTWNTGAPQICEEHPHLPFPHGTIRGVPRAGCSGPGMPAPGCLQPGQPVPTQIVLQVIQPPAREGGAV